MKEYIIAGQADTCKPSPCSLEGSKSVLFFFSPVIMTTRFHLPSSTCPKVQTSRNHQHAPRELDINSPPKATLEREGGPTKTSTHLPIHRSLPGPATADHHQINLHVFWEREFLFLRPPPSYHPEDTDNEKLHGGRGC